MVVEDPEIVEHGGDCREFRAGLGMIGAREQLWIASVITVSPVYLRPAPAGRIA